MKQKGISSIIATILMLIITTALVGTGWMFISGIFTSQTSVVISIVYTDNDSLTIRNDGTAAINSLTTTVDGAPASIFIVPHISGMVGYWRFEEGGGTSASDSSGNGNDGILNPDVTWETGMFGSTINNTYSATNNGRRLGVNISDANINSYNFTGNQNFTLTAWINYINTSSSSTRIIAFENITSSRMQYMLYLPTSNRITFVVLDTIGNAKYVSSPAASPLQKNTWYFVAGVYNTTYISLYINGVFSGRTSILGGIQSVQADPRLFIGRAYGGWLGYNFNGTIDEVGIFNRDLSSDEIKDLSGGLVPSGQLATVKILTPLSKGFHTVRLCAPSTCQVGYITIA